MAVDKTLPELFGDGAAQTAIDFTIIKDSLVSTRTPAAFPALVASSDNTAESLFTMLLMKVWETQDTSEDAQVKVYGPQVDLVEVVSDGVITPHQQFLFTIRILNKMSVAMPNPNLI
ncbi:hypothetical protein [Kamptonema sp. UHCC 0994]|uniref:hypothetical protein n=1 Tax=Kamptonema sp. UHCC 0994 TaxID=3031329 RepID=UPI0023B91713|nr:hypothetical protein [Kamptonema sp. UHCC 0994]MDF0553878.1 hypothetical protein [Kamptonema sp. UHCC 0994]